jgi:hypothetical protein
MNSDRELMQMALDALESIERLTDGAWQDPFAKERKALRDRLAQPEPEPVAWRYRTVTFWNSNPQWRYLNSLEGTEGLLGLEPLYTTPPNIEAAVLAEREACAKVCDGYAHSKRFDGYYIEGFADGADVCANAIRERGEK